MNTDTVVDEIPTPLLFWERLPTPLLFWEWFTDTVVVEKLITDTVVVEKLITDTVAEFTDTVADDLADQRSDADLQGTSSGDHL